MTTLASSKLKKTLPELYSEMHISVMKHTRWNSELPHYIKKIDKQPA